jgi:Mlc titration factor MtfA (ptsG expression regulator)
MAHRIISNPAELDAFVTLLTGLKLPVTVEWQQGRDRTLDQNRLQFLWAREASEQRGDMTADEVRCEWKLVFGVPILREESPEFRDVYDAAIKPLPYELKLKAMRFIPVTSEMKVSQMVRYLDTVQRDCLENGIKLTDPEPDLAAYQSRYRNTQTGEAA